MRSIGKPFNQCNQLIIILRVDKELRAIRVIRVLIKSTDCTDFTEIGCPPCEALDNRLISVIS